MRDRCPYPIALPFDPPGGGNRASPAREIGGYRHRAAGVGTGDVCPLPAGAATSGFSHGCRSRLLALDGPVSRFLEGMIAGDLAGSPSLTCSEVLRSGGVAIEGADGCPLADEMLSRGRKRVYLFQCSTVEKYISEKRFHTSYVAVSKPPFSRCRKLRIHVSISFRF